MIPSILTRAPVSGEEKKLHSMMLSQSGCDALQMTQCLDFLPNVSLIITPEMIYLGLFRQSQENERYLLNIVAAPVDL